MKFDKFADTKDAGRRADYADAPVGSTASQANRRDARGRPDLASLAKAIEQLDLDIVADTNRMTQIQARQGVLKNMVRGRQLPGGDYARLVEEQSTLLQEYSRVRAEYSSKKTRRHELNRELDRMKREGEGDGVARQIRNTNALLRLVLVELRMLNASLGVPPQADKGDIS